MIVAAAFFAFLIAALVIPVTIWAVLRVVPRIVDQTVPPIMNRFAERRDVAAGDVEERLSRIEEAIDAMAVQIERLNQRLLGDGEREGEGEGGEPNGGTRS
ncbi:MAG: hypothetical protein ACT4R6_02995 [Gemmatimonadaceae bacterium]